MRNLLLPLLFAGLVTTVTIAQTRSAGLASTGAVDSSWHCKAPNPAYNIPVPDAPGHAYAIQQFSCAATKGEIAGVKEKDGIATEFGEVTSAGVKGHGIFTETLANGDKLTVSYTSSATMGANNQMQAGGGPWTVTGGTGKLKGITGKGTCKAKGNADGTADFNCVGTYSIPK